MTRASYAIFTLAVCLATYAGLKAEEVTDQAPMPPQAPTCVPEGETPVRGLVPAVAAPVKACNCQVVGPAACTCPPGKCDCAAKAKAAAKGTKQAPAVAVLEVRTVTRRRARVEDRRDRRAGAVLVVPAQVIPRSAPQVKQRRTSGSC